MINMYKKIKISKNNIKMKIEELAKHLDAGNPLEPTTTTPI